MFPGDQVLCFHSMLRHISAVLVQAPAILVGGMNAFQLIKPFLLLAGFIYDVCYLKMLNVPFFHIAGGYYFFVVKLCDIKFQSP